MGPVWVPIQLLCLYYVLLCFFFTWRCALVVFEYFFGTLNVHETCIGAHTWDRYGCSYSFYTCCICCFVFFSFISTCGVVVVENFLGTKPTWDLYGCPYSLYECPYSLYACIMCYCVFFFTCRCVLVVFEYFFGIVNVHETCMDVHIAYMGAHTACMSVHTISIHELCVIVFSHFTWTCVVVVFEYFFFGL